MAQGIFDARVMSTLGTLSGGNFRYASAINLSGVVVGDGDTRNWRPRSWATSPLELINIFPNNGGNTHTVGVNNSGAICGYYTKSLSGNTSSWRGAIWTADPKVPRKNRLTDLPAIPGNDAKFTSAIPFAYNQSGQAAGWAVNDIISQHASYWNNDAQHRIVDLGVFPGDWSNIAWGMNDLARKGYCSPTPVKRTGLFTGRLLPMKSSVTFSRASLVKLSHREPC